MQVSRDGNPVLEKQASLQNFPLPLPDGVHEKSHGSAESKIEGEDDFISRHEYSKILITKITNFLMCGDLSDVHRVVDRVSRGMRRLRRLRLRILNGRTGRSFGDSSLVRSFHVNR